MLSIARLSHPSRIVARSRFFDSVAGATFAQNDSGEGGAPVLAFAPSAAEPDTRPAQAWGGTEGGGVYGGCGG
jgi:hypothetical protein